MFICRCIYAIAHVYIFKEITPKEMVKRMEEECVCICVYVMYTEQTKRQHEIDIC